MTRNYICSRCGKYSSHYLEHETQYTRTIIKRFWKCNNCFNLSDIQEIDLLQLK